MEPRIERLRQSGEFRIYTPGSQAGLPISILKSFAAPPQAIRDDGEVLGERVGTTATSLLGLLGVDADSMQSREHILISNILASAWKAGNDLELPALIGLIQNPPFGRVGVIDLESFFPAKDRFALALRLNNLLAAPGFATWLQGEPLDIGALLYAPDGKPRVSIISIAHLGEAERMFFVALLLNEVLAWVRTQPGTSSLRALLYMDEIFGYFPPVATPPSKRPLLTLLKQARAYGLGVVLATQNPADLDYKGLSNTGTWFIGRLQAERDKLRVLEGLDSAAAAQSARFDRQEMDKILSGLGKRTFLMHNVHEDHPQVFQVRWALSYLRGPLTRQQIKQLMDPVRPDPVRCARRPRAPPRARRPWSLLRRALDERPLLPPDVPQFFVPLRGKQPPGSTLVYRPMILGCGDVYFNDAKSGVSSTESVALLAALGAETLTVDWSAADAGRADPGRPRAGARRHGRASSLCLRRRRRPGVTRAGRSRSSTPSTVVRRSSSARARAWVPGRTRRSRSATSAFACSRRPRRHATRSSTGSAPSTPRSSRRSQEKIRRAEQAVTRESSQAWSAGLSSLVRVGTTILGAVMGRKTLSATTINKAGTALRNVGQTVKETGDVSRAKETVESLREQYAALEAEFTAESAQLTARIDPLTESLETVTLRPKKTNITPKLVALAWTPFWAQGGGAEAPAWR